MVNKCCLYFISIVLVLCSCNNEKRNDVVTDTNFVILNKSLSNELDTAVSDLLNFNTKYKDHLKYIHDYDPKRCNILVRISIQKGDTLVDFFKYDTISRNEPEIVSIVGTINCTNGITIYFTDEGDLTKGILYETHQSSQRLAIDYSNCLNRPMVLRGGELIINPPPLE